MAQLNNLSLITIICLILTGCSDAPKTTPIMKLTDAQVDTQAAFEYIEADNPTIARIRIQQALKIDPKAPSPWYVLGYLDEATGQTKQAEADYRHAIRLNRHSGQAHNNYGTFLCHENLIKEAIKQFNIAAHEPHYYNADTAEENAGLCLQRAGKLKQARQFFISATNKNPYLRHSLFELALINYQLHDYDQSKLYLQKYRALTKKPGSGSRTLQAYLKRKHHPPIAGNLPAPMEHS